MGKWRPPKMPDPDRPIAQRKTYAMYPEDVRKLLELAKLLNLSASNVLRELIQTAYIERVLQKVKPTPDNYALETRKW